MPPAENKLIRWLTLSFSVLSGILTMAVLLVLTLLFLWQYGSKAGPDPQTTGPVSSVIKVDTSFVDVWTAPSERRLSRLDPIQQAEIRYGRELIAHTADYLGPRGTVMQLSNGMNCQNCHLNAGTQPWGNNYFGVEGNYPKFRERSGSVEDQVKRVNDCLERSLNGRGLDANSREMRAILAYLKWLGSDLPRNTIPRGTGIYKLKPLDRATDPDAGRLVYAQKCQSCHQADGEGILSLIHI